MRKIAVLFLLSIFVAGNTLQAAPDGKSQLSRREKAKRAMLTRTGGFLKVPNSGKGSCLFLNLQTRIPEDELKEPSLTLSRILSSDIRLQTKKVGFKGISQIKKMMADTGSTGLILIIDDKDYPMSLVAPESRWGIVNVASLISDNPGTEILGGRVRKELWRTFALLFGAGNSYYDGCLMKTVTTAKDLDQFVSSSVCPEPFGKIRTHLQKIGVEPYARTTYRKACEQGWAPMPIDQYQRDVWQEVNSKKNSVGK